MPGDGELDSGLPAWVHQPFSQEALSQHPWLGAALLRHAADAFTRNSAEHLDHIVSEMVVVMEDVVLDYLAACLDCVSVECLQTNSTLSGLTT